MMTPAYNRVTRLVTRMTMLLALFVGFAPSIFYGSFVYFKSVRSLDETLHVQAVVLERIINLQPDFWDKNAERLLAEFDPYEVPEQRVRVLNREGANVFEIGPAEGWYMLYRKRPLRSFGLTVGSIEAGLSVTGEVVIGLLIFGVSLLVTWLLWGPVRRLPLAALAAAQSALREKDRYQRALLDNFPFMAWLADSDERLRAANAGFIGRVAGDASPEGRKLSELFPASRMELYRELVREAQGQGRPVQREEAIEVDGRQRWFEIGITPVSLDSGELLGTVGFARDITERKTAERELEQYRHNLEEMVRTRTAELELAREAAEAASRAKSEFLASMSHELRTPLNAILGFSQIFVMDPSLSEETRDMAGEIEQAGQHLLSLVNDLIDIARIEAGKLDLMLEPVAVRGAIADSLALVAPQAKKQGIEIGELVCRCNIDQITVQADAKRLVQVLINLLTNGVKYNRPGGTVQLSCGRHDDMVRIGIVDSGTGIPADKQARIFTAFDRLDAECGTVPGTGIGLVISKRIVEAMGGNIGFESVDGQGSTFWVEFPVGAAPVPAAAKAPAAPVAVAKMAGPAADAARPVVLSIEDNLINRQLIQRLFSKYRPDVELRDAITAEAGIEMAWNEPPALILMDINLPGMNGYEALGLLKADPRTAAVPVVAVTANAMKEDLEQGRGAGFAGYITKPIDFRELMAVVNSALAGHLPENA